MKSVQYLELVKAKYRLKTDSELAKLLDKSQNTISQYMSGKRVMDDETCLAVAMKLDINPLEVVGAACIDRAEKTGQQSLWEVFLTRMATTAAALLIATSVNLFLTENAANATPARVDASLSLYYVKWLIKKRLQKLIKLAINRTINTIAKLTFNYPATFQSSAR